jgi:hypothetical protein
MDYTHYTSVKNRFTASPNLCDLFKLLSIETWKRIEYAYLKFGVKVFETTITQNIIFSINAYSDQYGLDIEIFEAENERVNGNDFELIIRFPSDGLEYYAPIQAKKIYRDGRYHSMDHGDQIQSLMRYADSKGAKALYLLYNFDPSPIGGASFPVPAELIGCTLISAEYLFNNHYNKRKKRNGDETWIIPEFNDLNPTHAFCWHELVCPGKADDLYKKAQTKGIIEKSNMDSVSVITSANNDFKSGFFPINTFKQEGWENIKNISVRKDEQFKKSEPELQNDKLNYPDEGYSIEKSPDEKSVGRQSLKEKKRFPIFSPKSRIIISHTQDGQ